MNNAVDDLSFVSESIVSPESAAAPASSNIAPHALFLFPGKAQLAQNSWYNMKSAEFPFVGWGSGQDHFALKCDTNGCETELILHSEQIVAILFCQKTKYIKTTD